MKLKNALNKLQLFRFLLPEHNLIQSLAFLISSIIALNLFILNCNQLAIVLFCLLWFLNVQYSQKDKSRLINEIMTDEDKRKIYQEEIINIVQSRYLLLNDSINNYDWLNYLIKTKWAKSIRKVRCVNNDKDDFK